MLKKLRSLFGKKDETVEIGAPIAGEVVPIGTVNDLTFAQEILGKGVAIHPHEGKVVSPVSGTVTQMFSTGHAVTLRADSGEELLIHVGLDTLRLNGRGFSPRCKSGDRVKVGDPLIDFEIETIRSAGCDTVVPFILCSPEHLGLLRVKTGFTARALDPVFYLSRE